MSKMRFTQTVEVEMTVERLAELFCSLDDDQQARFFVECANVGEKWDEERRKDPKKTGIYFGFEYQWYLVGSHLKNCQCSTEGARTMIREIAQGLEKGTH